MSWLAISKELSGLVGKRQLGAGEFRFVSLVTGTEVLGKAELIELLIKEAKGWKRLIR